MKVATRQRLIRAAERGLAWRRERIMFARYAFVLVARLLGHEVDGRLWHSTFECDRHGHRIVVGPWVGPYSLGLTADELERDVNREGETT